MVIYKIKIFKKALERIEKKEKTIDLIFVDDKISELAIGDEIIYRNATNTHSIIVKGILHFDSIEHAINAINTKNLIGKTPVKALDWYSKNYQDIIKSKVIIICF